MADDKPGLVSRILLFLGKLIAITFLSAIGMGVVYEVVTPTYGTLVGGEKGPAFAGAIAGLVAFVTLFGWLSWLFFRSPRPQPGSAPSPQAESKASGAECPPLVAVKKRYTGESIEQALTRFEDAESEENFQGVKVLEQTKDVGGILVRYQMLFKYSVFDDGPYSSCVLWALLLPADPGVGDPADARFRVVSATAERHMPSM